MSPAFALIKGVLGKVHPLVWLIVAALIWGAFQRNRAASAEKVHTKAVAAAAAEREKKLLEDAAVTSQRLEAQKRSVDEARTKAQALAADAARLRTAEQQLRARLAAIAANPGAVDSTAASGGEAAGETVTVLANMLSRCVARARELAEYADAARTAGETCEASYESLTSKALRPP